MKKQKENSLENITWCEMGKQKVQAKEVNYCFIKLSCLLTLNSEHSISNFHDSVI